jgi:hypothetical protein
LEGHQRLVKYLKQEEMWSSDEGVAVGKGKKENILHHTELGKEITPVILDTQVAEIRMTVVKASQANSS